MDSINNMLTSVNICSSIEAEGQLINLERSLKGLFIKHPNL
jgi:hypothetical protein